MSTPLPVPALLRAAAQRSDRTAPAWVREPLLHFIVLGALLFAIDHAIFAKADDPHTIVVGADVDVEARALFKASRGREPEAAELEALRRAWLDNEVLYREGLALQVDRGDPSIRERVIFKALSVVDANVKAPPFDEKLLREWFERHRDKYDEPPRYDFQEAVLAGDAGEAAVRSLVHTLNLGAPGDVAAGLRVFKGRPHANIVQSYGRDFALALEAAPSGEWRAQRATDGWRAIRLESTTPGRPANFDMLHGVVLQDWTDEQMADRRTAAVRALAKKYDIRFETAAR